MVLGISITTFTLLHVLVSLLALIAGLVVVGGLAAGARLDGWTGLFLLTTFLTTDAALFCGSQNGCTTSFSGIGLFQGEFGGGAYVAF